MACFEREKTGNCLHFQCPHSEETLFGYECVEVFGQFCEVGLDCLEKCPYSWKTAQGDEVNDAIMGKYPGIEL